MGEVVERHGGARLVERQHPQPKPDDTVHVSQERLDAVRREHHGAPCEGPGEEGDDLRGAGRIHGGEWLVGDDQVGVLVERPCDRDSLLLAP